MNLTAYGMGFLNANDLSTFSIVFMWLNPEPPMAYYIIPFLTCFFVLELCMYWIFFYVQINGYIAQITQVFYDHQINSLMMI